MNLECIEPILQEFARSNALELSVETADWRLRVQRPVGAGPAAASPASVPAEAAEPEEVLVTVLSSLVGLFRALDPALQVGDQVEEGQPVAQVEALRVPTPVPAPCAGEVVEILVEDGFPVEYGQELLRIRPEESRVEPDNH